MISHFVYFIFMWMAISKTVVIVNARSRKRKLLIDVTIHLFIPKYLPVALM